MTDLHCHILPKMDDGSKSIENSIELLEMEKEQGVDKIVFTSHFRCDDESLESFLERRDAAFESLMEAMPEDLKDSFEFKLGAEVFFSPNLFELDLNKLCITDTSYILIELPFTQKPQFLSDTLYDISCEGITPIIAHVERYDYILEDLTQVYDWVEEGYCIQTNASCVVKGDKISKTIIKLIGWNLVHVISTDTHSERRNPNKLREAYKKIESTYDESTRKKLIDNGNDIFDNYELDHSDAYCPKKSFGMWR